MQPLNILLKEFYKIAIINVLKRPKLYFKKSMEFVFILNLNRIFKTLIKVKVLGSFNKTSDS